MTQISSTTVESCGKRFADLDAGLSLFGELEGGGQQAAGLALCAEIDGIGALALVLEQGGLGIEQVDLRGSAGHEQADDVFGFGRQARAGIMAGDHGGARGRAAEQAGETDGAESAAEGLQHFAPGQVNHGQKISSFVDNRIWAYCSIVPWFRKLRARSSSLGVGSRARIFR